MKRLQRIALTFTVAIAVLVAGASAALGLPRDTSSSTRTVRTGVVVVNTRLAFGDSAAGTGIVLTSSGEVLTNNHVIRGATSIRVTDVSAGRTYTATVAGYSISKDIALLSFGTPAACRRRSLESRRASRSEAGSRPWATPGEPAR